MLEEVRIALAEQLVVNDAILLAWQEVLLAGGAAETLLVVRLKMEITGERNSLTLFWNVQVSKYLPSLPPF